MCLDNFNSEILKCILHKAYTSTNIYSPESGTFFTRVRCQITHRGLVWRLCFLDAAQSWNGTSERSVKRTSSVSGEVTQD